MGGRGTLSINANSPNNKWLRVNQILRDNRIGILLVQETHLDEERQTQIENLFGRKLAILSSPDPVNASGRGGVAAVINRRILDPKDCNLNVIIPGRAILVGLKWHGEQITILAVYAPNNPQENGQFWLDIKSWFAARPNTPKPDLFLGDFNMVEEAFDRLPAHADPAGTTAALDELKTLLRVTDGWRAWYPDDPEFTFLQSGHQGAAPSQSRIDRIYAAREVFDSSQNWAIQDSGVPNADHKLVSVQIAKGNTPEVGKGRWSAPVNLIQSKFVAQKLKEIGLKHPPTAVQNRTDEKNAQLDLFAFKTEAAEFLRSYQKISLSKANAEIKKLESVRRGLHPVKILEETLCTCHLFFLV